MAKHNLNITVGPLLFVFRNELDWIQKGQSWFRNARRDHNLPKEALISIDARGRVCAWGTHFKRATADNAYPVSVYAVEDFEGN